MPILIIDATAPAQTGTIEDWVKDNVQANARTDWPVSAVYRDYVRWCNANGKVAMMAPAFCLMMVAYGFDIKTARIDNKDVKYFRCIHLVNFA